MKLLIVIATLSTLPILLLAQDDDGLVIGKRQNEVTAALYDLSDPEGLNIEVNVWGFVAFPGRYIVPMKTTFIDLMSYAGGPTLDSELEEIRIVRNSTKPGEKPKLIKLNYDDLMWKDQVSSKPKENPMLMSGDVILVMQHKRYTFREDIGFYLMLSTTLISMATLIITITNN